MTTDMVWVCNKCGRQEITIEGIILSGVGNTGTRSQGRQAMAWKENARQGLKEEDMDIGQENDPEDRKKCLVQTSSSTHS